MRRVAMLFLVAVSACEPQVNFAGLQMGPRQAVFQDHVLSARLDNGLRVAVLPDARTNLVTVTVRYEVGGADDPADASGLAHYAEHLLAEHPMRIDLGLAGNAMTELDRTYFFETALDTQLDTVLEAAARRFELRCNELDADVLARERDVVIEELKYRSRFGWVVEAVAPSIWGRGHPYAHSAGGAAFAGISKEQLCGFIDEHYGPGMATLVVTGHVDPGVLERIRTRFSRIPSRPIAVREQLPALPRDALRTGVRGLKEPTAAIVFAVPGEGSPADAAIDMLDGMFWRLDRDSPTRYAATVVVGEERQRVVVAFSDVDDPTRLDALAAALRRAFAHPRFGGLPGYQQVARNRFVGTLDDLTAASIQIADLAARGQPLTRYRALRDIDNVKPEDVARWVTGSGQRVLELLPEGDSTGDHGVGEIATALHHLDTASPSDSADLAPPPRPTQRVAASIVEEKLSNGLTVWLSPDPTAVSIDARVVMPFHITPGEEIDLADQAATELRPPSVQHTDAEDRVRWYRSIAVNVSASVGDTATALGVTGLSLFGDWHVWNLAWTVIHGEYREARDDLKGGIGEHADPPSAVAVAKRRLAGERAPRAYKVFRHDILEDFRRTHYDPAHATLIIAGGFELEAMRREVRSLFSEWRPLEARAPETASPPVSAPGFVAIPVLHSTTLDIAVGFPSSPQATPAEDAARSVLSEIINERLRVIREGLGVSYGVYARVGRTVLVGGSVEPVYAADAAHALLDALRGVREGDRTFVDAFVRARKLVLARTLAEPGGAAARASELERAVRAGRGLADLDREVEAIRTLDIDEVRKIAARDLQPEHMIAVVRGEPTAIRAALAALGATSFDTVTR